MLTQERIDEIARSYLATEGTLAIISKEIGACQQYIFTMFGCAERNELEPIELNAQVMAKRDKAMEAKKSTIAKNRPEAKSDDHCRSLIERYVESPLTERAFIKDAHTGEIVMKRGIEMTLEGKFGPELQRQLEEKTERNRQEAKHKRSESGKKARAKPRVEINHQELASGFVDSGMNMAQFAKHTGVSKFTIAKVVNMAITGKFGPELSGRMQKKHPKSKAEHLEKAKDFETEDLEKAKDFETESEDLEKAEDPEPERQDYELKSIAENFLFGGLCVSDYCNQMSIDMPTFNLAMARFTRK
jgi:hypothetical protein